MSADSGRHWRRLYVGMATIRMRDGLRQALSPVSVNEMLRSWIRDGASTLCPGVAVGFTAMDGTAASLTPMI